jgi:hypothetical protein
MASPRFIYNGPFDEAMPNHYMIIDDIEFWLANELVIYQWMRENLPRGVEHHQGMVVSLESERDAVAFLLRWG